MAAPETTEWDARPIRDVCRIISGGTPPKSDAAAWRGMFPWASGKDLKTPRLSDTIDHITEDAALAHSKIAPPGSVLVLVRGMGLANGLAVSLVERPMAFNQDLKALIPGEQIAGPFLMYGLMWAGDQVLRNVTTAAHGTKRLTQDDIADFPIGLPSMAEQAAISAVLDRVRAALDAAGRAERTAHELKASAMSELFARGLRGEAQKESEIGAVPESWVVAPLGESTIRTQYGLSIRGEAEGKHPILRMNCQADGRVHFHNLQYVDLEEREHNDFRLEDGDLLFNRTNSYELVGRMAIFEGHRDAVFASYLVRVSLDRAAFDPRFVNYYFNQARVQADLRSLATRGVSQANISASKLRGIPVPKPALDEQREIVAIINAIDRRIDLYRRKRALLDELFKALLHKLMAGEVRVADLEISALDRTAEFAS